MMTDTEQPEVSDSEAYHALAAYLKMRSQSSELKRLRARIAVLEKPILSAGSTR